MPLKTKDFALIENFRDFISRYRRVLLTCLDYAAISLSDHEKIVGAMKEGEPKKAEQFMRRHLIREPDRKKMRSPVAHFP